MISNKKTTQTAVTILLICLALAVLFWAVFFAPEVKRQAKTVADVLGCDVILIPSASEGHATQFVFADGKGPLYLPPGVLEKLRNETGIEKLTYHVHLGKPPADCCTYIDGPIIAFEEENDFIITPRIAEHIKDGLLTKNEILTGSSIHGYLGLIRDIQLLGENTKIVGHLKDTGSNYDNCVFMRVEDIATIPAEYLPNYPSDRVSVIFIQLTAATDISKFGAKIHKSYPGIAMILRGSR